MAGKDLLLLECDFSNYNYFSEMYKTTKMYIKSSDLYKVHPVLYKKCTQYISNLYK